MDDKIKTLTSLAILKVDIDEEIRDYLDYLVSFSLHVLKVHKPDPVTDDLLSKLLKQEFGLNVPRRGCQLVLRRLTKRRLLKNDSGVYSIEKKLPAIDFSTKKNDAQIKIEVVFKRLKKFAKEHHNKNWNDSDLTRAILSCLGNFGIDYLRTYIFKTALPEIPASVPEEQYIVSKFIRDLYENCDPVFEFIAVLVKGQMYANALVCPDLESLQKNFKKLTVFVDTALILNLLDLQGAEEQSATQELFFLVRQLRGTIAVFEHTVDEIINVIKAAEKNLDNPKFDAPVIREIRRSGKKRADLILIRENLREDLKKLNIQIKKTPPYEMDFQISEEELEKAISNEIVYRNPHALRFDINSVRSIYVYRKGSTPKRLEDSKAVFVTPNSLLAKAAFKLGQNHSSTKEVTSVVTDYSLANIAWLKAPLGAPELPTKELLANCYAAMEPRTPLWDKYIKEIDSLTAKGKISVEDHAILRISPLATDELMNLTLGEENALAGGTIRQILDRVKTALTAEKDIIIEKEKKKLGAVCVERNYLKEKEKLIGSNLFWIAGKLSLLITVLVGVVAGAILLLALFMSSFYAKSLLFESIMLTFLVVLLFSISIIWGFLNWYFGLSVIEVLSKINRRMHQKIFKILSNFLNSERLL